MGCFTSASTCAFVRGCIFQAAFATGRSGGSQAAGRPFSPGIGAFPLVLLRWRDSRWCSKAKYWKRKDVSSSTGPESWESVHGENDCEYTQRTPCSVGLDRRVQGLILTRPWLLFRVTYVVFYSLVERIVRLPSADCVQAMATILKFRLGVLPVLKFFQSREETVVPEDLALLKSLRNTKRKIGRVSRGQ